jgi:hypothetical protein
MELWSPEASWITIFVLEEKPRKIDAENELCGLRSAILLAESWPL